MRRTRSGYAGAEIAPIIPAFEMDDDGELRVRSPGKVKISSGVLAVLRIDGKLRGFAGGLGFAISHGRFEGDLMVLRSNETGAYVGARVRFLTGLVPARTSRSACPGSCTTTWTSDEARRRRARRRRRRAR